MILQQIGQAPRSARLIGSYMVTPSGKLAEDAAQEMRIAVVPAGAQRMREVGDLHAAPANSIGTSAWCGRVTRA